MTAFRVAVAGLGLAGSRLLLPALRRIRGVEVVVACDPDEQARARAAGVPVVADWKEAIATPSEAVIVATPVESHAEIALAAISAGRHLYVEKPMTVSVDEALDLCAAAEGRTVQVGFAYRFHPMWLSMKKLVFSGRVRGPLEFHGEFNAPRDGTGLRHPVVDVGCHHVDLVSWLTGSAPSTVRASQDGSLHATWPDGSMLEGRYVAGPARDHVRIVTSDGSVIVADRIGRGRLTGPARLLGARALPHPSIVRARLTNKGWERSYERALRAFVTAAANGRAAEPGPRDGLAGVVASLAALRSMSGSAPQPVTIPSRAP